MAQQSCSHALQNATSLDIMMPSFDCCCAMQALFEQAIAEKTSQHFPLLWRCYMSYEICRGRYEAARRVLLRAVHTCPGAKALWLDGLHFLAEQVMQPAGHWHWGS